MSSDTTRPTPTRRQFGAATLALLAGTAQAQGPEKAAGKDPGKNQGSPIRWRMATSWPKHFPRAGSGAEYLAEAITLASGGRLVIEVFAAGELVPALEVFDAVANGTVQMGHTISYYHLGKQPAAPFFAAIPFGFTPQEMSAWLYHGSGQALWDELYAPFGVVPLSAGNTGMQMAGWFRQPLNGLADLKGLKMRVSGLGAEVWQRLGVQTVTIPGGELFQALQSGVVDAAKWVGPYNDRTLGLYKAARHYYYPGWQEPGANIECLIQAKAWAALPQHLQAIVRIAAQAAALDMLSEFSAYHASALEALVAEGVEVRPLPEEILDRRGTTKKIGPWTFASAPVYPSQVKLSPG